MQTTTHAIAAPRRGRIVGLFLALLLQAGFVWVLVSGLTISDVIRIVKPIDTFLVPNKKVAPLPPPPNVGAVEPKKTDATLPKIVFETGDDTSDRLHFPPSGNTGRAGPADTAPVSVMATHTRPPYPPMEQRLGHEGTVVLRLTISALGRITDAVVVRSSGFERLDEAARVWVIAQWRYQPATHGGAAVASAANVAVTFNLKQAE